MGSGQQKYYDNLERYLSLCKELGVESDEKNMYNHQSYLMKTYGYRFAYDGYTKTDHIQLFNDEMNNELDKNKAKGDWREFAIEENREEILKEIKYHFKKLKKAVNSKDTALIREYSTDIGNIAMFMFKTTI